MFFCNLPNLCLRTFQVGTAFLEICTTTEPWVCSSNASPISPSSPNLLLFALPFDVSTPFAQYMMSPLSTARKLAVAANALYRVVSTRLKICPISFHVTCQLLCTVHDVSSVNGKIIGSSGQCPIPSGFDRVENLSDQLLFLRAQLSQFSLLHSVVCFVSHFLLVLFGHGDFQ